MAGANVNATNRQGHATALAIAASRGDLAVVEVLLQAEAQVNPHLETTKINVSENQPLSALAENVMSGLVAQSSATLSPPWCAAAMGYLEIVQVLIEAGADVKKQDAQGWTALDYAERSYVY